MQVKKDKSEDTQALKTMLVTTVANWVHSNNLTQASAAEVLGVCQSRISNLTKFQIDKFSVDALLKFMEIIGYRFGVDTSQIGSGILGVSFIKTRGPSDVVN